mmetsp:Transcript_29780/g.63767  ORF Transcript_29780/g.63767 Transcript_29780/m.63767 type:complete len:317 (-) Transcript_29780:123-1073(-)|eukprot:CAMPEP_0201241308 /NCGR_PEP_ID=MMETSP0852-20130820/33290_1 /ASSEMBLY_ACC=CAM_ASM_000632 /TAXON_ID=183588 /ORGANISM="Pseudo-nitzschia fraudulenta, Strain WWA7" /LENGTH=316 /DNA_ID=CAMNT_0047537485 /DNA_START=304 /DNA_END=1254 /DNA_ORIENTATION=+
MSSSWEARVTDTTWTCKDGITIAGKRWTRSKGHEKKVRIIALHGWMDNCATFDALSQDLMAKVESKGSDVDIDFVAVDLPGHGLSSHKSIDGPSSVQAEYCYYVYEVVNQLQWKPEDVTIIGHSMGGAVALLFAAAFPVQRLAILDSLGPMPKPVQAISKSLRSNIKIRAQGIMPSSVYPSFEKAVETRCKTPGLLFPGKQWISESTARSLVQRGSMIKDDGQLQFRHDQRLNWPSMLYLTEAQLEQIHKDVANQKTSTCLLTAINGMPFPPDKISLVQNLLKPDVLKSLPGSHHFHSDPDSVGGVVDSILSWLEM